MNIMTNVIIGLLSWLRMMCFAIERIFIVSWNDFVFMVIFLTKDFKVEVQASSIRNTKVWWIGQIHLSSWCSWHQDAGGGIRIGLLLGLWHWKECYVLVLNIAHRGLFLVVNWLLPPTHAPHIVSMLLFIAYIGQPFSNFRIVVAGVALGGQVDLMVSAIVGRMRSWFFWILLW